MCVACYLCVSRRGVCCGTAAETRDGIIFSFAETTGGEGPRVPSGAGVAVLERPAEVRAASAVSGSQAPVAAAQAAPAPAAVKAAAAPVPRVMATPAPVPAPSTVEAHPLVALIALAEILIDTVNPTAGQTRKIKRSAMRAEQPTRGFGAGSAFQPAGVAAKASFSGVALAWVATAVTGAVRSAVDAATASRK